MNVRLHSIIIVIINLLSRKYYISCFALSVSVFAAGNRQQPAKSPDDVTVRRRIGGLARIDDVTMLSDTQFHVADTGESLKLDCVFRSESYNLFDYPVIWRKEQLDEWSQINVMGSLNKPFVSTDRFEVTFTAASPRYTFQLAISGWFNDRYFWRCQLVER